MPSFPWPARQDVSAIEDTALAALLAGTELPAGASAELQPVTDVLAALRAGPAIDELAGLAAARAEFRRRVGVSAQPDRSRRRMPALPTFLLSVRAAAAAAIAAISLGGAATVAYAGALPGSLQQIAHRTIGAPAAHRTGTGTPTSTPTSTPAGPPAGPPAAGPAASGLCTAYMHALGHGTAEQQTVAFRNLVKAAGGAGRVTAFCAAVPRTRSFPSGPFPSPHRTGPPAAYPFPRPTWPPAAYRTGPPIAYPFPWPAAPPIAHRPPWPTGPPTAHRPPWPAGPPTVYPFPRPTGPPAGPPIAYPSSQPGGPPTVPPSHP